MWYGGIATADCLGCSLKCVFCWSDKPRDNPEKMGHFHAPEEVYERLASSARRRGFSQMRVSGNEPTLATEHLITLLELVEGSGFRFILETNGLHVDEGFAKSLSTFDCLHVRVSLKGTTADEFHTLTGARREAFGLQLDALSNLISNGVSCHPAVMSSFSSGENLLRLEEKLREIHRGLPKALEEETLILYPHVAKRLKKAGIKPLRGAEA
ncbi:radical SAM protein [candidate division TA06 bacterium]|uniref:Radical SAM protein n=1 Tax=candidate division TA06 bacterium TaxID=2250710 RepID=A0A523UYZ0_UNCT6|nr:MAG: radical SAM protein [candidate division TA06 bacterium]